jgi:hypothetical protein
MNCNGGDFSISECYEGAILVPINAIFFTLLTTEVEQFQYGSIVSF